MVHFEVSQTASAIDDYHDRLSQQKDKGHACAR